MCIGFLPLPDATSYMKEALDINVKLIDANLKFMTAWSYRKLAFEHNLSSQFEVEKGASDHVLPVCAIKAPGFENNRKSNLLTGGEVIIDELGMNLEKMAP